MLQLRVQSQGVYQDVQWNGTAQIGNQDLIILFTNSVSRKMVRFALSEAKRYNTPVACCHGSSASALRGTLNDHLPEAVNF